MALEGQRGRACRWRAAQPVEPVNGDGAGRQPVNAVASASDRARPTRARVVKTQTRSRMDHDVGRVTACGQLALDPVEVDAQAEDLGEAVAPADDLEQAVVGLAGQVAGAQLVDGSRPRARSAAVSGVAQHHVGPGVDELADLGPGRPGHGLDPKVAAGHRDADRGGPDGGQVGRQVGHPRGGLGLAVHHEEVEAAPAARARRSDDACSGSSRPPAWVT